MACQADEAGLSHLFGGAVHKQKVPAEPKRWRVRRMKQLRHLFGGAGHDQRNQRDDMFRQRQDRAASSLSLGVESTGVLAYSWSGEFPQGLQDVNSVVIGIIIAIVTSTS